MICKLSGEFLLGFLELVYTLVPVLRFCLFFHHLYISELLLAYIFWYWCHSNLYLWNNSNKKGLFGWIQVLVEIVLNGYTGWVRDILRKSVYTLYNLKNIYWQLLWLNDYSQLMIVQLFFLTRLFQTSFLKRKPDRGGQLLTPCL